MIQDIKGRIHSIQSLGTIDGPGIRFVVFCQGCNLRCGCCHNPDTWDLNCGSEHTAQELAEKALRYKSYFGTEGGITVSGGEPLLQPEFVRELFSMCHKQGINTCLDTSGSILNEKVKDMLKHTDRVLLDIKYTNSEDYKRYAGCDIKAVLSFLKHLNDEGIPTTIRQVIIPEINDTKENIYELKKISSKFSCVDKIELLPFKKICKVKYDNLGIDFPFDKYPVPDSETMRNLESLL